MSADRGCATWSGGAAGDVWHDAQRVESLAGEIRVNLIRLIAILLFYGHHLVNAFVLSPNDPTLRGTFHTGVTALVLAWSVEVVALYVCLRLRWFTAWLKYAATAADTLLITAVLVLTSDPKSMLAVLYFLVIAAAGLRLALPLVYVATLATILADVAYQAYAAWWLDLPDTARVSRTNQVIFLLSLVTAGLLTGQLVRQARRLAMGQRVRVLDPAEGKP